LRPERLRRVIGPGGRQPLLPSDRGRPRAPSVRTAPPVVHRLLEPCEAFLGSGSLTPFSAGTRSAVPLVDS
jgi:hypothetical protein